MVEDSEGRHQPPQAKAVSSIDHESNLPASQWSTLNLPGPEQSNQTKKSTYNTSGRLRKSSSQLRRETPLSIVESEFVGVATVISINKAKDAGLERNPTTTSDPQTNSTLETK